MTSLRNILGGLVAAGLCAASLITGASLVGEQRTAAAVARGLDAKDLTADILPPPLYLIEARLALSQAVENTVPVAEARKQIARLRTEYEQRIDYWRDRPIDGPRQSMMGDSHEAGMRFLKSADDTLAAIAAGDSAMARQHLREANGYYTRHRTGVDATVKVASAFADSALAEYRHTAEAVLWLQGAVFATAAVLLIGLGLWARRTVWASTGGEPAAAAAIANAVAEGQLSVHVPVAPGDTHSVMAALARMCANLSDIVQGVRNGSDAIALGTAEIAAGNTDLSVRTEQQASNVQQTAAAMEQFSGTVKQTADAADQASNLASGAAQAASLGAQEVARVVETMDDITASSRRIGEITSVIDGIAFQTNILALNAAVEAARAGEQGRGFAVVAGEVRVLAQRCASAAKEINSLITQSGEKVESGAALVRGAGATMSDLVGRVERVNQLIHDISTAAREQTQGIDQVSRAISELDSATQQNAALVEQSANAAGSLSHQATALVASVSVFRLDEREALTA